MSFDWENDNNEEFRDNPVEFVDGKWQEPSNHPADMPLVPATQRPAPRPQAPAATSNGHVEYEEYMDEIQGELTEAEEDEDFTEVLSDARLRLEQGRLYEMIMNHDLFQEMDADPKAVKHVQREIRRFAKERMEIMLGMRQPVEAVVQTNISLPFNDLEISLLKELTNKMSKGKTAEPEAEKYATWNTAKKENFTPIMGSAQKKQQPRPLQPKPKAPLARPKVQAQAPVPQSKQDEEFIPLEKPPQQMTPEELLEYNKRAAKRQANRKAATPSNVLPQATFEQQEMLYTQRAMTASPTVSAIMALMKKN